MIDDDFHMYYNFGLRRPLHIYIFLSFFLSFFLTICTNILFHQYVLTFELVLRGKTPSFCNMCTYIGGASGLALLPTLCHQLLPMAPLPSPPQPHRRAPLSCLLSRRSVHHGTNTYILTRSLSLSHCSELTCMKQCDNCSNPNKKNIIVPCYNYSQCIFIVVSVNDRPLRCYETSLYKVK